MLFCDSELCNATLSKHSPYVMALGSKTQCHTASPPPPAPHDVKRQKSVSESLLQVDSKLLLNQAVSEGCTAVSPVQPTNLVRLVKMYICALGIHYVAISCICALDLIHCCRLGNPLCLAHHTEKSPFHCVWWGMQSTWRF